MHGIQVTALHNGGIPLLRIQERVEEPGVATLTLSGELDHDGTPLLEMVLARTWAAWPETVTIDLRLVGFVNARGLASLLRTNRTARARRVRLVLQCRPGLVGRLLVLVGLVGQLVWDPVGPPASPLRSPAVLSLVPAPPAVRSEGPLLGGLDVRPPHRRDRPSVHVLASGTPGPVPIDQGALDRVPEHPVSRPLASRGVGERDDGGGWAVALVSLDRVLAGAQADVDLTRRLIVDQMLGSIAGAEHASLASANLRRLLEHPVVGSPEAATVAGLEQRAGEGPSRDSHRGQHQVVVADLRVDGRWPGLTRLADQEAVRSMLSVPLTAAGRRLGVLTLHSDRPGAFDARACGLAADLAARAATALAGAQVQGGLVKALASRDVIGQAKGILMASHRITAEQAFELLSRHSQHRNMKVVDLAAELIYTGELSATVLVPGPRGAST